MDYPLFIPPDNLAERTPPQWTKGEAELYLKWFTAVAPGRVAHLFSFVGEESSGRAGEILLRVGKKVAEKLREPTFSKRGETGPELTDRGYAIAADVGLLVAKLFLDEFPSLSWTIQRKPKTDVSYNRPVLSGFGKVNLDPLQISVTQAFAVLAGDKSEDTWSRIYEFWKKRVQ